MRTYDLRITLMHLAPPIWRRVRVDAATRLDVLHDIIQAVMGWEDAHLHAFHVGKSTYMRSDQIGDMSPSGDEAEITLQQVAPRLHDHFEYLYDFGDGWQHRIEVVAIDEHDAAVYVPVLLEGENACPPDDCGGAGGYEELLAAFFDEHNPGHDEVVDSIGDDFNPNQFDHAAASQRLRELE